MLSSSCHAITEAHSSSPCVDKHLYHICSCVWLHVVAKSILTHINTQDLQSNQCVLITLAILPHVGLGTSVGTTLALAFMSPTKPSNHRPQRPIHHEEWR